MYGIVNSIKHLVGEDTLLEDIDRIYNGLEKGVKKKVNTMAFYEVISLGQSSDMESGHYRGFVSLSAETSVGVYYENRVTHNDLCGHDW